MPRFLVQVEDTTFDVYEVEADDEDAALELAEEIHCEDGTKSPYYQGGGCEDRKVFIAERLSTEQLTKED